jgi:hypothetical protein
MVNIPSPAAVFAAFFGGGHQGEPGEVAIGLCDRIEPEPDPDEPVPFRLTDQAEAALDADLWNGPEWDAPLETGPEAEAEWADEWDSADSNAYMDRVEAGLEPEAEL